MPQANLTMFSKYNETGSRITLSLLNDSDISVIDNSIVTTNPKAMIVNLDLGSIAMDNLYVAKIDHLIFLFDKYYDLPNHEDVRPERYTNSNDTYFVKGFSTEELKTNRLQVFLFDLIVWATQANLTYVKVIKDSKSVDFNENYIANTRLKLSFVTN